MGMCHLAVPPLWGPNIIMTDHVMSMLHACHELSGWPNKRAWEQILDISPTLLEFGLNDPLLFFAGPWWCKSSTKMTKRVTIEKSKLCFVVPKIISVIPYPCHYLVSYPLSLKLFCQLSLIPKTPNRASEITLLSQNNCNRDLQLHQSCLWTGQTLKSSGLDFRKKSLGPAGS